jgi:hypothetical protein
MTATKSKPGLNYRKLRIVWLAVWGVLCLLMIFDHLNPAGYTPLYDVGRSYKPLHRI